MLKPIGSFPLTGRLVGVPPAVTLRRSGGPRIASLLALVAGLLTGTAAAGATPTTSTTPPEAGEAAGSVPAGAATSAGEEQRELVLARKSSRRQPAAKDRTATVAPPQPIRSALPPIAKPGVGSAAEADYIALLDKAIAPLRDAPLSVEDASAIVQAFKAVASSNLTQAGQLKSQMTDPVARKLIDWYRLRGGFGEAAEYRDFLKENPGWPDRPLMTQRLEEALFLHGGSASAIKSFFDGQPPRTGIGMAALASAHLAEGNEKLARELASRAWREQPIPATLETGFLDRFKGLLSEADHKRRLDRLLVDDVRWKGERNDRAAFVRRLIPLLSEPERKKASARLAVFLHASNAGQLMSGVAAEPKSDWGLAFHRAQQLRRSGKIEEASRLLLSAPGDAEVLVNPDAWWSERRANAYEALAKGRFKAAYELVEKGDGLTVNPLKEQAFMAGWLALRKLGKADAAARHFAAMSKAADGPLSRAKAEYWLGRTAEARGDRATAVKHYKAATADGDTFHGLLALEKLHPDSHSLAVTPPARPTEAEIASFVSLDAVRAVVIARKAGLDANIMRRFLAHLRTVMDSEAKVALLANLAEALGDTQSALRIGKAAIARGQNLMLFAYPVHPFPAYTPLRKPPETAFLLGIARQETEFNRLIVSGAGAKGLLQVMTITAKHVCQDYKMKCEIPRLVSDASYNATIASAYIGDRMDEFGGSYVLTLAGYNAGPGRARQWIRQFGDPRDAGVDSIDWIEMIPFQETREYVSKVLSNIQVYRARLGEKNPLRLGDDLVRARGSKAEPKGNEMQEPSATAED